MKAKCIYIYITSSYHPVFLQTLWEHRGNIDQQKQIFTNQPTQIDYICMSENSIIYSKLNDFRKYFLHL